MTEYTDEQIVQRKQHAQRLLDDELLAESFDRCEEAFTNEWKNSAEEGVQQKAWAKMNALKEVRRLLEQVVNDGDWVEEKLASIRKKG